MVYVVTWVEITDIKLVEEWHRLATDKLQSISVDVDVDVDLVLGYLQNGQFDFPYDSRWRQHPIIKRCYALTDTLRALNSELIRVSGEVGVEDKLGAGGD